MSYQELFDKWLRNGIFQGVRHDAVDKFNPYHDPRNGRFTTADGSGMNIDAAIKHLNANAGEKTKHRCAAYVRQAIQAGGMKLKPPFPSRAKDYGTYLEQYGFTKASTEKYQPQKGDIVVFQPYPGGDPAGHIQMYNGVRWISDFTQHAPFWPGSGYASHKSAYAIYRP